MQELVRLPRMGTGCREVARLLAISPNTERQYREILAGEGLLAGPVDALPEFAELKAAVVKRLGEKRTPPQTSSVESWSETVQAMMVKDATPQAIYDCLRLEHREFAGSLSAIKRLYARLRGDKAVEAKDIVIPVLSAAGEIAQGDFGYVGKLYDPAQGVLRKAWVFVMVLTSSRHLFARVVFDQRVTTWMALHVEAFAHFGGVVETVVPDNLKAAVIRAAFGFTEQPALNRSYRELARHYGFKVDPAPPYSPEKKGGVESGVKYVKRNFFAPRDFADIHEANRRLDGGTTEIAGQRLHGTTHQRPLDRFAIEQAQRRPLPPTPFECVQWKEVPVHTDSQIEFERRLYPVPWRLMGKQVWVQATPKTIAVYWDDTRGHSPAQQARSPRGLRSVLTRSPQPAALSQPELLDRAGRAARGRRSGLTCARSSAATTYSVSCALCRRWSRTSRRFWRRGRKPPAGAPSTTAITPTLACATFCAGARSRAAAGSRGASGHRDRAPALRLPDRRAPATALVEGGHR